MLDVAEAVDDGEDYSEYEKIKDEDEEEKVDMCMAGHNRFTPG